MAVDTRDKRSSAINLASPWRSLWPAPDSGINQGDRQQTAFMYRGIQALVGDSYIAGTVTAEQRIKGTTSIEVRVDCTTSTSEARIGGTTDLND